MTRKKVRENIFLLLFRVNFYRQEEWEEQASLFLEELEGANQKAKDEIRERFLAVAGHLEELDAVIEARARGWDLKRLAKADITILRLASYEIIFDESVPGGVAINEAVELSKSYGTDKSSSFVNGVLASVLKDYPEQITEERRTENGDGGYGIPDKPLY